MHRKIPIFLFQMFMLDLLDNLPRLRLSDDHLKSIIWVMRECKTPDVPSFSALRKKQEFLTREIGIKSEQHTSSLGNHFYMNHPSKLLALAWQAEKWTVEADLDDLSPMWANRSTLHRHFYIKELAQLHNGTFVVPLRWVTVKNIVHAEVHLVEQVQGDLFNIKTADIQLIPASSLESNYLDLHGSIGIKFTEYSPHYSMPHPLRQMAKGRPIFRLRIMPWSDDVSGNVSKQYNAHTNMYVTNLNLPHQKLQQEYFIRFASTSPYASSSEQFVALGEDCVPGAWHDAYDCELEQEILFEIIQHVLPADNPQQSETSSHIGMAGSLGCRRDDAGGSKEYCETDEGYHAMYAVSRKPRKVDVTIQVIRWQVWMACLGNKSALDASYTLTGVKDKISQHWISLKGEERIALKANIKHRIQKELWDWVIHNPVNLSYFQPMIVCLDPHHDTPAEILHTYLLGNDKYVWHDTTKTGTTKRVKSLPADYRLHLSPASHFPLRVHDMLCCSKSGVFQLHDLCTPLILDLWKATGELGAYLWFPEIKDMRVYLADLQVLVDNLLDIWGLIDPNRILVKGKLHVLPHTLDDTRRFGPCVTLQPKYLNAGMQFSDYAVFCRTISLPATILRQPWQIWSDSSIWLAAGWWQDSTGGKYIRAGSSVRSFLTSNRELQRRLGWSENTTLASGMLYVVPTFRPLAHTMSGIVKLEAVKNRVSSKWNLPLQEPEPVGATWAHCKYVSAKTGDLCKPGFWVFIQTSDLPTPFPARITKILAQEGSNSNNATVIVEPFVVLEVKDARLNMPLLVPSPDATLMAINPMDIMLSFNVQHDCVHSKCKPDMVRVRQERTLTDRTELQITHTEEQRFILNMHALHNGHLIRDILPRSLTAPVPYLQDRVVSHRRFAEQLRKTGPVKRAETRAKTQATRAKNKQGKLGLASAQSERQQAERVGLEDEGMDED
ncbi:hypothetical protein B0H14DRAFT_3091985 [Mycena olivaceomarginata]|nr:hypothetical protein B0H14DRAFT_3091985 [Mycena olivaceomarginata]